MICTIVVSMITKNNAHVNFLVRWYITLKSTIQMRSGKKDTVRPTTGNESLWYHKSVQIIRM